MRPGNLPALDAARVATPSEFLIIGQWGLYWLYLLQDFRETISEVAGVADFLRPPFVLVEVPNREENVILVKVVEKVIKIIFITGSARVLPLPMGETALGCGV
jgi:hypothetical protein